ncbi:MAG: 3-oxoacyl-ACP reductase [SAR324 cluster bacterium]|uniref:3-oxoacyl-ACP reductase n=1 Tax=SAR324 cluster bacterium TaxID=2024889 RepID=A0A2A4T5U1_9DELT|nr:MAG: 3-oxoacyl-ACP reductase [SAR324 cluster bacterium]
MELKDKVIVITGAAQGLGRSFATSLAKKGANVALVDLNKEKLLETQDLCQQEGIESKIYLVNVAEESAVKELFQQVVQDFGRLDGLLNNAGITRDGLLVKKKEGALQTMSIEQWQQVIDVNLTGVFLCGREAAAQMVALEKPGVIINISSISRAGNMGQSNYTAAKAGVASMTVTWAKELSRYGIRVGAIAPGFINTELVAAMREDILAKTIAQVPLGRMGEPEELAHAAIFILENDYFTGRVLELDGGLRI